MKYSDGTVKSTVEDIVSESTGFAMFFCVEIPEVECGGVSDNDVS